MRIKTLTLFSHNLESQKEFYRNILGFELSDETAESFSIAIGWSTLIFRKTAEKHIYHYCFLIPSNKFEEAFEWFDSRLKIVSLEGETKFALSSWNAQSFYFYDGNGNIAECIVRYDMQNPTSSEFSTSDLLCVNEIGAPTSNIQEINEELESKMGSYFWKGNTVRFGTNGDEEGLFLLVNNEIKKDWFPTKLPTQSSPFEAEIETKNGIFDISFSNQKIKRIKKVLVH